MYTLLESGETQWTFHCGPVKLQDILNYSSKVLFVFFFFIDKQFTYHTIKKHSNSRSEYLGGKLHQIANLTEQT